MPSNLDDEDKFNSVSNQVNIEYPFVPSNFFVNVIDADTTQFYSMPDECITVDDDDEEIFANLTQVAFKQEPDDVSSDRQCSAEETGSDGEQQL